jgi:hypothetical protein
MKILLVIPFLLLFGCANQSIETEAAVLNSKAAQQWCNDDKQQLQSMTKQTAVDGKVIQSLMTVECGVSDDI